MSDNHYLKDIKEPIGLLYMPQLESLEIQNCELGDNGIAILAKDLSHLVKIRELNVANNQMTSSGLLELSKGMARCKGLTSLRLQKNNLGKDGYFVLASWLRELILLEVLNISECCIADKGASIVAGSILSGSLKKLSMRSNGFTIKGSQEVFEHLQRPPALEHIDFSDNCIFLPTEKIGRSMSMDIMTDSEPFTRFLQYKAPLSHLSLWKCGIGEHRIFQDYSKYESFKELTYVCFQENKIHDEFAIDFAVCIKNHSRYLQHLNLRHNSIGTQGALELADALKMQDYLEEVLLDRNVIGDPGAIRIVEVCTSKSSVKSVDLSCNYISRETMSKIAGDIGREEKWVQVVPADKTFQRAGKMSEGSDENKFVVQKLGDNFTVIT
jgi:Ran GTPase-activating protein (RanGAP) involved in mRNA processing and transport